MTDEAKTREIKLQRICEAFLIQLVEAEGIPKNSLGVIITINQTGQVQIENHTGCSLRRCGADLGHLVEKLYETD